MKASRRILSQIFLTAMTVLLISILVFLYIKANTNKPSDYFQSQNLTRQIEQLDARWEAEVLKSRIGLSRNYDLLVEPLNKINQLWAQFEESDTSVNWRTGREAYLTAIKEKTRLIERFKSHNALLRNSLDFLPTAEEDIDNQLASLKDSDPQLLKSVTENVDDLLLSSLEFAQLATDDKAADILVGLGRLAIDQQRLPVELQSSVDLLVQHINLILREQPVVNQLLEKISAVPVAAALNDITDILDKDQEKAVELDQQYHKYLLILSTLLVALLLYMAIRLLRSYSEINRVNRALHAANEGLEQRVEERTRELKDTQSELIDTARLAGMAEIATNVLHNVGNVLNSVNISADLVTRKLRASKAIGLSKAVKMINEHAQDLGDFITHDEKGKLLPGYLNQLDKALTAEQQSMTEELEQLTKSVDHIKDIVATQQSYAGASSLAESLNISDLLEDALRMNSGALTRHQVTVVKDFSDVPSIMADKHRLLLILINLISNAKYAMSNMDDRAREMTLGVKFIDDAILRISVKDEGEGIPLENMTRIFAHGFTTRKEGHGFGLHSCALAAIEMNGQLSAHSDGPGKGAIFTLELPLKIAMGGQ